MENPIKVLIAAVVLVVLIGGGFFAWQYFVAPEEEVKDETADWKTYKNEKYGIEFQYPNSWILNDGETSTDQTKGFIQINISNGIGGREDESVSPCQPGVASILYQVGKLRDSQQTFEDFVNFQIENPERGLPPTIKPKLISTMIGGQDALKIEEAFDNCTTELYYIDQSLSRYTTISSIADKNDDKLVINQILSTFKFINSTLTSTEVIKYVPTEIPSEIQEGSCWINALTSGRKGTWRCVVENRIYDPCFVASKINNLICDSDPITKDKGFQLKLTEPLPEDMGAEEGQGWLIELEDWTTCRFITGATGVINGKRINYMCSDDSWILGDLQTGTVWKAEKAEVDDSLQAKSIEFVRIRRVWR